MPTYDYVCQACGHAFEHFQTMTSRRLRTCPACKLRRLERLVGAGAGIIFKGSGFYETDYKRKAAPTSEKGSTPSESEPAATAKPAGASGEAPSGGTEKAPPVEKSTRKASGKDG